LFLPVHRWLALYYLSVQVTSFYFYQCSSDKFCFVMVLKWPALYYPSAPKPPPTRSPQLTPFPIIPFPLSFYSTHPFSFRPPPRCYDPTLITPDKDQFHISQCPRSSYPPPPPPTPPTSCFEDKNRGWNPSGIYSSRPESCIQSEARKNVWWYCGVQFSLDTPGWFVTPHQWSTNTLIMYTYLVQCFLCKIPTLCCIMLLFSLVVINVFVFMHEYLQKRYATIYFIFTH
jgi:hypothetical protein